MYRGFVRVEKLTKPSYFKAYQALQSARRAIQDLRASIALDGVKEFPKGERANYQDCLKSAQVIEEELNNLIYDIKVELGLFDDPFNTSINSYIVYEKVKPP